jgi:hypothetical protein
MSLKNRSKIAEVIMPNRTTHRSTSGSKLYAKRSKSGQFEDVQSYKRAHGQDVKRKSQAELAKKKQH